MRVVVLILCDFQMASLDWRRSIWWHRNARIPFNCTKLINKLLFSTLPWSHPTQHVCACQTAAGPLSITVCHVPHCVIQSQCSFLKKSQYLTKTVPSTSPTASHTLPSFISPAVCVINSSAISLFFFFPQWRMREVWRSKIKVVGTSLVVQWIRICLPGTLVWSLVQQDSTCRGATKPVHRNYWSPWPESLCSTTRESSTMGNPSTTSKSSAHCS